MSQLSQSVREIGQHYGYNDNKNTTTIARRSSSKPLTCPYTTREGDSGPNLHVSRKKERTEKNRKEQKRTEKNRKEQNRTEKNRKEEKRREKNRKEQKRREKNRATTKGD